MDFELTELQTELADGMRRLCQGQFDLDHLRSFELADKVVDRTGWRQLGEAGVFNLRRPGSAGGVGLGLAEAALVFEELGRALVPGPLVATHLAAGVVDGADDGSVVVGLIEARSEDDPRALPLVVEHLHDLDVLLVLSDDGVSSIDPTALEATRLERPDGSPDPGMDGHRPPPGHAGRPVPTWPHDGAGTEPSSPPPSRSARPPGSPTWPWSTPSSAGSSAGPSAGSRRSSTSAPTWLCGPRWPVARCRPPR